jgi:DNA-binding NarL/FixJ family response regulator
MSKIKVVIADSNFLIRQGIKSILEELADVKVVAEAQNSTELEDYLQKKDVDVIVIDYSTFKENEIEKIVGYKNIGRLMCITNEVNNDSIKRIIEKGVNSHIFKDCDKQEIIDAVYATSKGERFFCGKILESLSHNDPNSTSNFSCQAVKISNREAEIIRLIAEGFTTKQIADILSLSSHTIVTHKKNIFAKLGINNTASLVLYAMKENIINS